MLIPITTKQFEKDVKKAKKQGKEIRKLKQVMKYLIDEVPLQLKNNDHKFRTRLINIISP